MPNHLKFSEFPFSLKILEKQKLSGIICGLLKRIVILLWTSLKCAIHWIGRMWTNQILENYFCCWHY